MSPPRCDPRWYQITALTALLGFGVATLQFGITPAQILLTLSSVVAFQYLATRLARLPLFDPRSALISGLSLCLLLRTQIALLLVAAAALAIGSKFLLRSRGKHWFNPTSFALAALLTLAPDFVWISPGQWGNLALLGFLLLCLGSLVVVRAARVDVTAAFLVAYIALLFGRSLYLGEPLAIPWHRFQSGALLLFSFFMISDPKTTPDSRPARLLFGALVAGGAWYIQFRLFRTNGLLWSLVFWSCAVPLLDWLLPARRYVWSSPLPPPRFPTALADAPIH